MSRRAHRPSRRSPSFWVQLLCACVLAVLTSGSTLAWALPPCGHADEVEDTADAERTDGCCDHGAPKDSGPPDDTSGEDTDDDPCSCPLPCGPCCGLAAPALMPSAVEPAFTLAWTTLDFHVVSAAPPEMPPGDVLHVPKRSASFPR